MFIDRLMNQGNLPVLQQVLQFTEQRHRLIAENIANVDTPGYRQKDLSVQKFQSLLQERISKQQNDGTVGFDDIGMDVENPRSGILFHDGNNRSMEQLQADLAKNAMLHNTVVELMRKQYQAMEMALKERLA